MSVKNRKRRQQPALPAPAVRVPCRYGWLYPFALGFIVASVIVFAVTLNALTKSHANTPTQLTAGPDYPTLGELTGMSDDELRRQDLALVNLRCAEGLPGSENLDIQKCLATINQWAQRVQFETERHLYRAHDPRFAKHYRNSEAYLRASMLIQVLQEDLGVKYNMKRVRDINFTRSEDLFIHGMIARDNGGTCVSMPVLYTAIGRRLGYPIHLTTAKSHLFCRWDDGKESFNIEGSGEGFSSFDDDYYLKWPMPISEEEFKAGHYLKSLSPGEELAVFLSARGHCLEDNERNADALVCYAQALQQRPNSPEYFSFLVTTLGFRPRPVIPQVARPQPIEPPMDYPTAHDPFTYARPTRTAGKGWAQPTEPTHPYNVFKPYAPSTGYPNGFQNPVADTGFGFSQ
jgi:hypothetical protein